ncbi:hypothetical protein AJ80_03697 [Polytolypa hystricis UAMH7299]|uniref:Cupin type-1 domain-containing protein n=1 Tax=Polytolypa hystricis (strain UAMH7299) TaxID=1447883 RepID=A0A2B7YHF3_POLH7|nr:hypothetical protein AJ80_03697 [Polytolypa hystricis UAMH7299]
MHIISSLVLMAAVATAAPSRSSHAKRADIADPALIRDLITAPTMADRIKLLPNDSDFVFKFSDPPFSRAVTTGDGGRSVTANRATFPALIGSGVSMTVGFLDACGFNTPHTHPRAAEMNIVVEGRMETQFIMENGARPVYNKVEKFDLVIFPPGSMHAEFNPDCEPATFVAGFGDEDHGVQQTAQTFFGLDNAMLDATLGGSGSTISGKDIDTFRDFIPKNIALGVDACLEKCGLSRNAKRELRKSY